MGGGAWPHRVFVRRRLTEPSFGAKALAGLDFLAGAKLGATQCRKTQSLTRSVRWHGGSEERLVMISRPKRFVFASLGIGPSPKLHKTLANSSRRVGQEGACAVATSLQSHPVHCSMLGSALGWVVFFAWRRACETSSFERMCGRRTVSMKARYTNVRSLQAKNYKFTTACSCADPIERLRHMFVDMTQKRWVEVGGQCPARRPVFLRTHASSKERGAV